MTAKVVHILCTGVANVASVAAAIERAGTRAVATSDRSIIEGADHLVLPGVGAFGPAMARLDEVGAIDPLRSRIIGGRPTLCICLGLQLLFEGSEESPGVAGLSVLSGSATRFSKDSGVRVPQLGWNTVEPGPGFAAFEAGHAYYANSYRVEKCAAGPDWTLAETRYAGRFVAAASGFGGRVLACQFHPELSGPWGQALINRWLSTRA